MYKSIIILAFISLLLGCNENKNMNPFLEEYSTPYKIPPFQDIKLEHDYLSSAEKLLEYKKLYFENELIQKDIKKIRIIKKNFSELASTMTWQFGFLSVTPIQSVTVFPLVKIEFSST